ncbi:MAG: hypothetical protein ACKOW3_10215 [Hyphomicrobium sp.]
MKISSLTKFLVSIFLSGVVYIFVTAPISAQTVTCSGLPGTYVKLPSQSYALCAGATSVNFDEITYAKCTRMYGTSISTAQTYPFPSTNSFTEINSSGNIATVNQGAPGAGGYVVSTYSPPMSENIALYTCNDGGSYAQCDGGLCFSSTTGKSSPLWGSVSSNQIICSCPITTSKNSFQVFGPATCPTSKAEYDAICSVNASRINNGAVHYIGAPTGVPEGLAKCLGASVTFKKCNRP